MSKVTVGVSTIVGFAAAAAAVVIPLVGDLADAAEPLGVSPAVWVVVSAVLTVITVLGRMWQAAAAAGAPVKIDNPVLDPFAPDTGDADPVDLDGNPVTPPAPVD